MADFLIRIPIFRTAEQRRLYVLEPHSHLTHCDRVRPTGSRTQERKCKIPTEFNLLVAKLMHHALAEL